MYTQSVVHKNKKIRLFLFKSFNFYIFKDHIILFRCVFFFCVCVCVFFSSVSFFSIFSGVSIGMEPWEMLRTVCPMPNLKFVHLAQLNKR